MITNRPTWLGYGWLIALVMLLLAIVLMATGQLAYVPGGLIAGVALARLVP